MDTVAPIVNISPERVAVLSSTSPAMPDSGDDLSSAADIPADAEIETCIREVVREAVKNGEEVTVNLSRTRAEERLGLDAGFLKDDAQWKRKSKELVSAAFQEPSSPVASKTAPASKAKPVPQAGTKRKSDEEQQSRKKQKKDVVSDAESEEDFDENGAANSSEEEDSTKPSDPKPVSRSEDESALSDPPESEEQNGKKNNDDDDESELSSVIDEPQPKKKRAKKSASSESKPQAKKTTKPKKPAKAKAAADDDDQSDHSSVIDDPPPPKKGRKKKSTSPAATTKSKAKAGGKDLTPDEEEIKRLQSWLLKCGIRKMWHRELAPYETNKERIKHLKGMLEEAGMTGRFSAEKAKQIKEKRELEAELEAVGEFNEVWGREKRRGRGGRGKKEESDEEESDEEEENGKSEGEEDGKGEEEEKAAPGRRAKPKGFVDFGDSDEDSD